MLDVSEYKGGWDQFTKLDASSQQLQLQSLCDKAIRIYDTYILEGCPHEVVLSSPMRRQIRRHLQDAELVNRLSFMDGLKASAAPRSSQDSQSASSSRRSVSSITGQRWPRGRYVGWGKMAPSTCQRGSDGDWCGPLMAMSNVGSWE